MPFRVSRIFSNLDEVDNPEKWYTVHTLLWNVTEAVLPIDEPLTGVTPLEAMDFIVDPRKQELVVNPQHPNDPVALAKIKKHKKAVLPRLGKKIVDRTSDARKSADDFFIGGNQRNAEHLGQGNELAVISRTSAGLNQLHDGNRGNIVFIAEHQAFGLPEDQQLISDRQDGFPQIERQDIPEFAFPKARRNPFRFEHQQSFGLLRLVAV
jgi:hypothetical protein